MMVPSPRPASTAPAQLGRGDEALRERRDKCHVTVLMATYNGEDHIEAQLRSIACQTHRNWSLVASDDGSTDRTRDIITAFAAGCSEGQVVVVEGPGLNGNRRSKSARDPREFATMNFLSLLVKHANAGDVFALADQDDVWAPDKLSRALDWITTLPPDEPALYCARTSLIDEAGHPVGFSPLFRKPPSFRNALVQSLAGGNTMVLNTPACDLLKAFGVADVVAHDWWLYLVLSGCGARIFYDPMPSVGYRQHDLNLVGSNRGFRALVDRARMVAGGTWADWTDRHIAALRVGEHLLTPENRLLLNSFVALRGRSVVARLRMLTRLGLYRQTRAGQLTMAGAILSGRL